MTGYGADCAGCSSTGTVSCKTKNGLSHSLRNNGTTYNPTMNMETSVSLPLTYQSFLVEQLSMLITPR